MDDGTFSQLVENYIDGITELIERHAPICQHTITLRPNALLTPGKAGTTPSGEKMDAL